MVKSLRRGAVICLDGPDGVGKTTEIRLLADELQSQGFSVETIRLYGGSPIGEMLREVAFSPLPRPARSDLHLALAIYYALAPKLNEMRQAGKVVLVDRSPLSIIAYQVYGDGLNADEGYAACGEAMRLIAPDLTLLLLAPLGILTERHSKRHGVENSNYFENQPPEYHERVLAGYNKASLTYAAKIIEASSSADDVHAKTLKQVELLLDALSDK
jgi:dTMP kinase